VISKTVANELANLSANAAVVELSDPPKFGCQLLVEPKREVVMP